MTRAEHKGAGSGGDEPKRTDNRGTTELPLTRAAKRTTAQGSSDLAGRHHHTKTGHVDQGPRHENGEPSRTDDGPTATRPADAAGQSWTQVAGRAADDHVTADRVADDFVAVDSVAADIAEADGVEAAGVAADGAAADGAAAGTAQPEADGDPAETPPLWYTVIDFSDIFGLWMIGTMNSHYDPTKFKWLCGRIGRPEFYQISLWPIMYIHNSFPCRSGGTNQECSLLVRAVLSHVADPAPAVQPAGPAEGGPVEERPVAGAEHFQENNIEALLRSWIESAGQGQTRPEDPSHSFSPQQWKPNSSCSSEPEPSEVIDLTLDSESGPSEVFNFTLDSVPGPSEVIDLTSDSEGADDSPGK